MTLPESYERHMRELLGDEFAAFAQSLEESGWPGLRANRLKITPEALRTLLSFEMSPVRWCAEGFVFAPGLRPAKSWMYHAGLFYIQEPSAMSPASVLDVQPGDKVLDLCAAPGGKAAQLAARLNGRGLLLANDASASRCKALVKNIELAGVTNAAVSNETPRKLAQRFPGFFDRILVDAPCSGEGMFRKDPDALRAWAEHKPSACAQLQREILRYAADMLKPGGRMIYSTCTFEPLENEAMIHELLSNHEDFSLVPINHAEWGLSPARPDWVCSVEDGVKDADAQPLGRLDLSRAARIWPHKACGEGHFLALLEKSGEGQPDQPIKTDEKEPCLPQKPVSRMAGRERPTYATGAGRSPGSELLTHATRLLEAFCDAYLNCRIEGSFAVNGSALYLVPEGLPAMDGLRVARSGWYLGEIKKGRFEPSQALAMGVTRADAQYTADLTEPDALRYLKGESITHDGADMAIIADGKPWVLVCISGYPLGWGRLVDGRIKNQLPPGWVMG